MTREQAEAEDRYPYLAGQPSFVNHQIERERSAFLAACEWMQEDTRYIAGEAFDAGILHGIYRAAVLVNRTPPHSVDDKQEYLDKHYPTK